MAIAFSLLRYSANNKYQYAPAGRPSVQSTSQLTRYSRHAYCNPQYTFAPRHNKLTIVRLLKFKHSLILNNERTNCLQIDLSSSLLRLFISYWA